MSYTKFCHLLRCYFLFCLPFYWRTELLRNGILLYYKMILLFLYAVADSVGDQSSPSCVILFCFHSVQMLLFFHTFLSLYWGIFLWPSSLPFSLSFSLITNLSNFVFSYVQEILNVLLKLNYFSLFLNFFKGLHLFLCMSRIFVVSLLRTISLLLPIYLKNFLTLLMRWKWCTTSLL